MRIIVDLMSAVCKVDFRKTSKDVLHIGPHISGNSAKNGIFPLFFREGNILNYHFVQYQVFRRTIS